MRVLIVDDDQTNQLVVAGILERNGIAAVCAANGVEALDALARQPYDLILMDIQMPIMDGVETTRCIRAMAPPIGRIPIIAVTATATAEERARCLAAGMDDFIGKPFHRTILEAKLAEWRPRPDTGVRAAAR